ncbi:Os07g0289400, partial [Oryza sativa Japonica Group]
VHRHGSSLRTGPPSPSSFPPCCRPPRSSPHAQLEQSTGRSGLGSGTECTPRRWSASGRPLLLPFQPPRRM